MLNAGIDRARSDSRPQGLLQRRRRGQTAVQDRAGAVQRAGRRRRRAHRRLRQRAPPPPHGQNQRAPQQKQARKRNIQIFWMISSPSPLCSYFQLQL